jgi:hypothetical protein
VDAAPDARAHDLRGHVREAIEVLATPGNRELKTSIDAWSVLKKDRSTAIVASVMQLCPDGWSGNAGVESRARASLAAC